MSIFLFIVAALLPVLFCIGFYLLEKYTAFGSLQYIWRQIVIGVVFGGLAIMATEVLSIDVGGALSNVRDAAPLTAGLMFGGPAGVIAGVIGGAERALCVLWGGGTYTAVACSVSTALAGVFGFLCRKFMFGNRRPSWPYAFLIGLTMEVLHMLLIFVTNMTDIQVAFTFVQQVSLPMILANSLSVTASAVIIALLEREKLLVLRRRTIAQIFETLVFACVAVAFAATSLFTYYLQDNIVTSDTKRTLSMVTRDVTEDIREASDLKLLESARSVAGELTNSDFQSVQDLFEQIAPGAGEGLLFAILAAYADEINVVDENGIIVKSTNEDYIGFDMNSGQQSAEFTRLLGDTEEYVQSYGPISADSDVYFKYAGKKLHPGEYLPNGGFVQVGLNSESYYKALEERVKIAAENRHLGREGFVLIFDEAFNLISAPEGHKNDAFSNLGAEGYRFEEGVPFLTKVSGITSYCQYSHTEGYYIIAVYPERDAALTRNITVYVLIFVEILVFSALFIVLYLLIKKRIVGNMERVNDSLGKITGGDLDVVVDVRDGLEFSTLSDDINATVTTLKHYIEAEAKRLDKELEFAHRIQLSALPSVFPPYPDHTEFEIFASMDAAKEVGGDFYDFYFAGRNKFVFMIADVSGKGIPAAMFMMTAKTHLRNMTESGMDIAEVFTEVNKRLCENNAADMFVTAWMGAIDLETGVLSFVNAGHNPPLIKRADGSFEYLRSKANFILAGMDMTRYKRQEVQLSAGDEIFLDTDGVTEATNPAEELFGEERLQTCLNEANTADMTALCKEVKRAVDEFADSAPQFDDITMVAVKFNHCAE